MWGRLDTHVTHNIRDLAYETGAEVVRCNDEIKNVNVIKDLTLWQ